MIKKVTIIGTGAYGTVLANVLTDNGIDVIMYGIEQSQVDDINENHKNSAFFNNKNINSTIKATTDLAAALENTELLILSVPTFAISTTLDKVIKIAKNKMIILNVAKGLDGEHLDVLSKYIIAKFSKHENIFMGYAGLYGPSVAIEVLERKPTCINAASNDINIAKQVAAVFSNEYFGVFPTTNLIGTEIAAAVKNTIAIASGLIHGLNNGSDNTKASLITMGLIEMMNLAVAYGASEKDLVNYASVGDLILTATSPKTRNFRLGMKIAAADDAKSVLEGYKITVEGVLTCKIAYEMVKKVKISAPLIEIMFKVLYNNDKPSNSMNNLFRSLGI
ncbi:NAD(P)H-dependent glycerol-3-phosphate dehydrogenase [Spiroplasma endosymbiont of Labia minor]|uniref:NAD(P)H-dependent glycerol-3-phosphate dehydrogenase n=1 Tax=Spiroplasma endosymbiont of Labia minor TaxID=3066305 RepID=UPI0030D2AB8C